MNSNRSSERSLLLAIAIAVVAVLLDLALLRKTGLQALRILPAFPLVAMLIACGAALRLRLRRLAEQELEDFSLAQKSRNTTPLFDASDEGEDSAPLTLGRSRDQFERYLAPLLPLLLVVLQGLWGARVLQGLGPSLLEVGDRLMAGAFLIGQGFVLFLFSRYLLGLGRMAGLRLCHGPGVSMGVASLASFAAGLGALASETLHPGTDRIVAYLLTGLLLLLALEIVLLWVAGFYSPRRRELLGLAYESRLGELVTTPSGWTRNIARTVDYQFGFQVSETGGYRLIQRTVLPLLGALLLTLYLMSCFVFIGPEENGIRERMGRPLPGEAWRMDSGFHLKIPWPFETVRRLPAKRILHTHIGYAQAKTDTKRPEVVVWTIPHHGEEDLILTARHPDPDSGTAKATPGKEAAANFGFVSLSIPIQYRISDLYAHAYNLADPAETLQQLARQIVVQEMASRDLIDLLGASRLEVSARLQRRLQEELDLLGAGMEITFLGLQNIHPPVAVAEAFETVVSAAEYREAAILLARAYQVGVLPRAQGEAERLRLESEAYKTNRVVMAEAEIYQFEQRLKAQAGVPEVFRTDLYLSTLTRALANTRKFIVDSHDAEEVLIFNFEERPKAALYDIDPETTQAPETSSP